MIYNQAGYLLVKPKEVDHGPLAGRKIITASSCFNDSYYDSWSLSWTTAGKDLMNITKKYGLKPYQITELQAWCDQKFNENKIGWPNIFYTLDELKEFTRLFFSHRSDLLKIGVSFADPETESVISAFGPQTPEVGETGIRHALNQKRSESPGGNFIGFDMVGVNLDGSLHTLHCHAKQPEFEHKFSLSFNQYGLISESGNWKEITDYCNDQSNGLEPVPWFHCKVKLFE